MNGSMEPTRISDRTASRPAAARSTTIAVERLQAGPPCSAAGSWPPSVRLELVNWKMSESA